MATGHLHQADIGLCDRGPPAGGPPL